MINVYTKLRVTLLQHLEHKQRGLMAGNNNVCKTIRQEMYAAYYDIKC